jgi:hypothetical protein
MLAIPLILLFVWIASALGTTILARFAGLNLRPLERAVYGGAIGLGIAAYGVYLLGLCGALSAWPVALWWLILAVIGASGMRSLATDLRRWLRRDANRDSVAASARQSKPVRFVVAGCTTVLILMALIAVVAAFQPPGPLAWDALSYHLADPKVFVLEHRIRLLPAEHHSNFPFMVEMLFAVGLLYNGYVLANLFHTALAVLTTLCILTAGERRFGRAAGAIAATLFATTPLVLWEASVAYIDVGSALYTTLAAVAAIQAISEARRQREAGSVGTEERNVTAWLTLAGASMGFAMGIKYLALIPLALIGLLLLVRGLKLPAIARYVAIALLIGAPWYVKNAVLLRNPVYPFFYHLFPQSRYWSEGRAVAYQSEQTRFGYPHKLSELRESLLNLLEAPWRTLADTSRYYNGGEMTFSAEIGGLYAAFGFAGLLLRRSGRAMADVALLAVAQVAAWFFLAQVGRYLIQILPLLALLAGATVQRLYEAAESARGAMLPRLIAGFALLLVAGNVLLTLWSVTLAPSGGGKEAVEFMNQTGLLPTALSMPEALSMALHPAEREEWLRRYLDVYDAEQWINNNTAPNDGVVLYEETRGFYLDRPYIWGNDQHSSYIPYAEFHSGEDITKWMNAHGYRYAIINLNFSARNPEHARIAPEEAEARLQEWYVDYPSSHPEDWYRSAGQAIRAGLWRVAYVSRGNVVLQIGPGQPSNQPSIQPSSGDSETERQGRED